MNDDSLSCSVDGDVRVWSPQKGRGLMQNPFYECSLVFSLHVWLTKMALSHLGPWQVYVADSEGNIHLLRKNNNNNSINNKNDTLSLMKYTKWEKVHNLGISFIEVLRDENIIGK